MQKYSTLQKSADAEMSSDLTYEHILWKNNYGYWFLSDRNNIMPWVSYFSLHFKYIPDLGPENTDTWLPGYRVQYYTWFAEIYYAYNMKCRHDVWLMSSNKYKSCISSLCGFPHPVTVSHLGPNIVFSTLVFNTLNSCSSLYITMFHIHINVHVQFVVVCFNFLSF